MIEAENLRHPAIAHGFFTRAGGVSGGIYEGLNCGFGSKDDETAVGENRARAAQRLGVAPTHLLTGYQVHSPTAVAVTEPWHRTEAPEADGFVTATPGIALGVLTADCAPVLFADAQARVIGAAHAGWRGATGGVLEATIARMEALGADRARIAAAVGPAIGQANYEVGADMRDQVLARGESGARFFVPGARPDHWHFDLEGYAAARLRDAGLGSVEALSLCTYADETRFFSFRRTTHRGEPDYGRQISAIVIRPA